MMKYRFYLLVFLFSCIGCNELDTTEKTGNQDSSTESEKSERDHVSDSIFDKTKWKIKVGFDYPYRNDMFEDLMNNQGIRELKKLEILELLGEPNRSDCNYLFYTIDQKRIGFFPLHTKTMVIKFSGDGAVEWIKIHQ